MSANPATLFGPNMTLLTGNNGGSVQSLPQGNEVNAKERLFIEQIALASQASGSIFAVARIPLGCVFLGITVCTDTSLGSATIEFGDAGSGNSAIYGAAATLTSTNTPTVFAKAGASGTYGQQITSGYDSVTGAATSYTGSSGSGGNYEDVTMTTGAASLPSSGNLTVITRWAAAE